MSRVLLLQLDGKIPNLALMRIASHHRQQGDEVELRTPPTSLNVERGLWNDHDTVYASLIFERTRPRAERLLQVRPDAVIGGTGWSDTKTLGDVGIPDGPLDYSDYPAWPHSLGFTQRGCRLKCGFCKVPTKEPDLKAVATVREIWRGEPWPKNLLLLDNDFFGVPSWRREIEELNAGGFKVCWNQGFNVRLIGEEEAKAIASTQYRDDQFKTRMLYTAWDNRKDERRLFRNLELLAKHGVAPDDITVYMLIGYWAGETEQDWLFRQSRLREFGARPYPMPYDRTNSLQMGFQRWCIRRSDMKVSWQEYKAVNCRPEKLKGRLSLPLFEGEA